MSWWKRENYHLDTHDRVLAGKIPRVEEVRNGQLVTSETIDQLLVAGKEYDTVDAGQDAF